MKIDFSVQIIGLEKSTTFLLASVTVLLETLK
jgi:hypothetical protein